MRSGRRGRQPWARAVCDSTCTESHWGVKSGNHSPVSRLVWSFWPLRGHRPGGHRGPAPIGEMGAEAVVAPRPPALPSWAEDAMSQAWRRELNPRAQRTENESH